MRKKLNEKGVTLVSLVITITVIMIITGTIIYNVKDNLKVQKVEQMRQDIENLSEKISTYYAQYGKIPAKLNAEYTNIKGMQEANVISSAVDTGKFYVIDLQAIENLTLTYGQDYETVKTLTDATEINSYDNLYIINEASHNIFYPKGIEIDGKCYYTTYTEEGVDKEAVELHYIDNIKIPDGYRYMSGTKYSGIIIKDETTGEQYKWIVSDTEITELPEGIVVDDEIEFLNSVNFFSGYYQSIDNETKVFYLPIEEKWSHVYDETEEYVDKNGDIAVIPEGFKVNKTSGTDTINEGLVIKDEEGNEFVWVPVSKEDFGTEFIRRAGYYNKVAQDISAYGEAGGNTGANSNTNVKETEITVAEAKAMYSSVQKNGGFYIGRYEAGKDDLGNVVVKKGANVYNKIGWNNDTVNKDITVESGGVVQLARNFDTKNEYESVVSTLCYSVQWDTALKFIDSKYTEYALDSSKMGWYNDNYKSTSGEIKENNSTHITGKDLIYLDNKTTIANKHKNIYDMAGNVQEWTMESVDEEFRTVRGGYYGDEGIKKPSSYRNAFYTSAYGEGAGFRIALYIEKKEP